MNFNDFEAAVLPLTEKELLYRKHPSMSRKFYTESNLPQTPDHVYRLGTISKRPNISHGMIGNYQPHYRHNLTLCKQTRFSDVPLHTHDYIELNFVYSGECTAILDNQKITLKKGQVCILDTEVVHTILPLGEKDIILNILMTKSYFQHHFFSQMVDKSIMTQFVLNIISKQKKHDQYLLFHTEENEFLRELILRLFCEYFDPKIESDMMLDSLIQLLFIELTRSWQAQHEHDFHKVKKNYMSEILQYIELNYNTCTLKDTAEHFGFHPNALSRKIKKETDRTFEQIITYYRLQSAEFQLLHSDAPVSVIAEQCGYNNQKTFYAKFSEAYGCTPGEYRKKKKS